MPAANGTDQTSALASRRGPDLLTLVVGLGALGIAVATLLGGIAWLPDVDGRWVLAVLALIVGSLLVIGSLRPQKPPPRDQ
ncbi:MAG TPA: hypothetical protein VF003_02420 [Pseudonocardiaceae bacterium]